MPCGANSTHHQLACARRRYCARRCCFPRRLPVLPLLFSPFSPFLCALLCRRNPSSRPTASRCLFLPVCLSRLLFLYIILLWLLTTTWLRRLEPSGGQPCGLRPVKRKRSYLVTVFSLSPEAKLKGHQPLPARSLHPRPPTRAQTLQRRHEQYRFPARAHAAHAFMSGNCFRMLGSSAVGNLDPSTVLYPWRGGGAASEPHQRGGAAAAGSSSSSNSAATKRQHSCSGGRRQRRREAVLAGQCSSTQLWRRKQAILTLYPRSAG